MTPKLTLTASRLSTLLHDPRINIDCDDQDQVHNLITAIDDLEAELCTINSVRREIIYLAAPYTHPDAAMRQLRANSVAQIAAALAAVKGFCVYSPITHGVGMQAHLPDAVELSHDFWMLQCLPLLRASTRMLIAPLPGWADSQGIQREMREAQLLGIPVGMMQHDEIADLTANLARLNGHTCEVAA